MKAGRNFFSPALMERRLTMKNSHNSFTKSLRSTNTASITLWFNTGMKYEMYERMSVTLSLFLISAAVWATPSSQEIQNRSETSVARTDLIFHQVNYDAKVSDDEARFLAG